MRHGNFHDFDENHMCIYRLLSTEITLADEKLPKITAAKRSRFVLIDVEFGGGETDRVVLDDVG